MLSFRRCYGLNSKQGWYQRHKRDEFVKKAQSENYRARSAFKLKSIDDKFHIFSAGMCVLDLGCRPGSWCQVAAEKVGPRGMVIGVDLIDMEPLPNVHFVCGDILNKCTWDRVHAILPGSVDLILR